MEGESILQAMAEIAVAFAGFTGVVAAFGHGGAVPWSAGDRLRFQTMLGTSLAALLFALLPFVFYHIGFRGERLWVYSSSFMGVYLSGAAIFYLHLFRSGRASPPAVDRPSPVVGAIVFLLTIGTIGAQFLNALGMGFHREFGAYLLGVAILLLLSSVMFVRLLSFVRRVVD